MLDTITFQADVLLVILQARLTFDAIITALEKEDIDLFFTGEWFGWYVDEI